MTDYPENPDTPLTEIVSKAGDGGRYLTATLRAGVWQPGHD